MPDHTLADIIDTLTADAAAPLAELGFRLVSLPGNHRVVRDLVLYGREQGLTLTWTVTGTWFRRRHALVAAGDAGQVAAWIVEVAERVVPGEGQGQDLLSLRQQTVAAHSGSPTPTPSPPL